MKHFALAAAALLTWALPALAESAAGPPPTGFWERPTLLGELGGLRPALERLGITLALQEQSEIAGNISGGLHTGAVYSGLTTASLTLDTKALGLQGGKFFASALQIHGRSLNADNLALLQTVTNIEASRATRLWELWYQQEIAGAAADVKLGQQSLDQEFLTSQYSAVFLNAMMGWPALPSNDLYAGGPVFPLSSLGIRVRAHPTGALTVLAGVYDDNPPGGPFGDDSQLRGAEASGTRFNLTTGALWIAEAQYTVNPSPDKSCFSLACGLSGTYKLGAWYDTGQFPDQRLDSAGLSLASPASSGTPLLHRGNFSLYGLADQAVWREVEGKRALAVFFRAMGAPGDRNLVDWSFDTGVNFQALLPGREDDVFGIGYGQAHVSRRAAALDRDRAGFTGTEFEPRSAEHVIELTYQAQLAPWWQLQPDFQYAFNPGGGIQNPEAPARRLGDEAIFVLRTTVTF